jgi:kinesin family protein C2/C3
MAPTSIGDTSNESDDSSGFHSADIAYLRADLLRTKQELKHVQDAFDEYTQSSQELEQELEQELTRAETKNALLLAKNAQFEADLHATRDKLEIAVLQVHRYETELSGLRDELALAVKAKRTLEQEQDDLLTQVRILQATEEDLHHKMEREMEEKVFLVSDQEELQRNHELAAERFRTEIMDLKSELYALQQKHDGMVAEQSVFRGAIGDDKNQMEIDEDDDTYLSRGSTVHERDADSQEVLIESLQREIEVLSSRAQEETDAREKLEAELIRIQDSLANVEAMEAEMMEMTQEVIVKAQDVRTRDLEVMFLLRDLVGWMVTLRTCLVCLTL